MVIDCFIFNDELPMLKFRPKELNDVIDYFVLVESVATHPGIPKPLYYRDNQHLFNEYKYKIQHVIVDDVSATTDPWHRENHQRNAITRGVVKLKLDEQDMIVISDCDEIPDPNLLKKIGLYGFNIFADDKNSAHLNQSENEYDFGIEVFRLLHSTLGGHTGAYWLIRTLYNGVTPGVSNDQTNNLQ